MNEREMVDWVEDVVNDHANRDVLRFLVPADRWSPAEAQVATEALRRRTGRDYNVATYDRARFR